MVLLIILVTTNCKERGQEANTAANSNPLKETISELKETNKPLYRTSITATDIDFITEQDPDAFKNLDYLKRGTREMPGSDTGDLMDNGAFIFKANFTAGNPVEIWAHSSFGTSNAAKEYAQKLSGRLGKLPLYMRNKLSHVILHKGDSNAFAEDAGGFFVLYSENMDARISTNDLEETVFHETVHVAFDLAHAKSKEWKQAQEKDVTFITEYAQSKPEKEDLAESAIFAYAMIYYPGRLNKNVEDWVRTNIPNRLKFLKKLFEENNSKT
ncbi:Hypothetical protein I595_1517 [Croceitalea dokdonensis DOKDO 023]|uniref:Uncharacterized protein n=2 Tax=Croceitalea TaxID=574891 RepID=A0A0P7B1P4_9FLAO|nr:Hypothetical protein I595_1517 [Croceitalea dokdonensis DOKDO 023]